jgi:hypothetical protein
MKPSATPASELYCSACEHMFDTIVGTECPRDGTRLVRLVAQADPFVGRDLDGRYVIKDKLGQGGMGAVYRAVQRSVDREVAIKVVNPTMMADPVIIKRFLREARLASRLNHPNAVAVLDFGQTTDGVFYLVMELVPGRTLEAIIEDASTLSPARMIPIAVQICSALEGAHAVMLVHRDLKPANVIVDAKDHVKVLDFGIAKSLSPDTISPTMTSSGAVIGSPGFMPPEIAQGRPCERADQYSLGCILYLAVTGHLPFDAETLPAMMRMHAHDPVPPLPATVPRALNAVILRLLEKDPDARFAGAGDVRVALESALARPSSPLPWVAEKPKRRVDQATTIPLGSPPPARRWPWLLGALVAIGGGVAAAHAVRAPQPPATPAAVAPAPRPTVEPIIPPPIAAPPVVATPEPEPQPEPVPEPPAIEPVKTVAEPTPTKPSPTKPKSPKPIAKPVVKPAVKSPVRPTAPRPPEDPPPF